MLVFHHSLICFVIDFRCFICYNEKKFENKEFLQNVGKDSAHDNFGIGGNARIGKIDSGGKVDCGVWIACVGKGCVEGRNF